MSSKGAVRFLWIVVVVPPLTASKLLHLEVKVLGEIGEIKNRNNALGSIEMESYHWFFLGMMVAFTPSLLVLSVLLVRSLDRPVDTRTSELSGGHSHSHK